MPRFARAALTAILSPFVPETLHARAPGRDFPRCVQSCIEVSKICKDICLSIKNRSVEEP